MLKRVKGLIRFYRDTREENAVTLNGESSLVVLRDFHESLAERGRAVPGAARHALAFWDEALGIDWPLANPLVLSDATVATNEAP